jgi:hypothetical protein
MGYQILFLVIGWLLGLLSPVVVDFFTRKRRQLEVKQGLRVELAELRFSLVNSTLSVASSAGALDQEYVAWLKAALEGQRGAREEDRKALLDTVGKLGGLDEQQLAAVARSLGPPPAASALTKHRLPYLAAHMDHVSSLPAATQRQLLEIQAQLGVINELLDDIRFVMTKSFDSLPTSTRQAIDASLQSSYRAVLQSSRNAADLIGALKLG